MSKRPYQHLPPLEHRPDGSPYAGLVEIQKQGCGKPNRIYPKSYEAVPNTDFKKSGYGTPEG